MLLQRVKGVVRCRGLNLHFDADGRKLLLHDECDSFVVGGDETGKGNFATALKKRFST